VYADAPALLEWGVARATRVRPARAENVHGVAAQRQGAGQVLEQLAGGRDVRRVELVDQQQAHAGRLFHHADSGWREAGAGRRRQ
jgi:hypothetical protein